MICLEGHISQITMKFEEAWNGLNHHHPRFLDDLPSLKSSVLLNDLSKFNPIVNMQSNYNSSQKNGCRYDSLTKCSWFGVIT